MKKSELKEKILELKRERDNALTYVKMWEESSNEIVKQLVKHGVRMDVKMPEVPKIESTSGFDTERKFVNGLVSGVPVITFDFTEHDMNVLKSRSD